MASKPFLSYTGQINNLINNKHLLVNDIAYAWTQFQDKKVTAPVW